MPVAESAIDLTALIDRRKLGWFHIRLILLCALCCFGSGFYAVALGFVAPVVSAALALNAGALGPAFAASGLGSICGSFGCTPLADRIGRKPVIVGGMLLATPFIFLMGRATSVPELMWLQFFGGFGLMGIVPIILALAGEFMPKHSRITLTMLVWIGFNLGSICAGFVAISIAAGSDWQAMFFLSSAMPLIIAPLAAWALPKSLDFLAERHASARRIAAVLVRFAPEIAVPTGSRFFLDEKEERGFPVSLLFHQGRTRLTLLLWVMFFTNIAALVFLNSWLSTILVGMGMQARLAFVAVSIMNAGGIIGGIAISKLCDRFDKNRFYIMAAGFLSGGAFMAGIAIAGNHELTAFAAAFIVGFFTLGTQNTANAVAATIYPTAMRSTGAGWAIGIGNSAMIVSPLLGGFLLSQGWSAAAVLSTMALSTVFAATGAALIGHLAPDRRKMALSQ